VNAARVHNRPIGDAVPRITEHYNIAGPVPFADVQTDTDSKLFVTPTAIRLDWASPVGANAQSLMTSFAAELIRCRESPHAADHRKGLRLVQEGLNEPNETRLGYTSAGSRGHGFGPYLGEYLWQALSSPLCKEKLMTDLEHLPLFIPRVERDLISDMSTRVVFDALIDFTLDMVTQYPMMAQDLRKSNFKVWDADSADWLTRREVLPFVGGRYLLLVPKHWVNPRLHMAHTPFYTRVTTNTLQEERTVWRNGVVDIPLKRDLYKEFKDIRGFNSTQTLKHGEQGTNLVSLYTHYVDENFTPISDLEIQRRTAA
jgi:hypothetical protein